MWLLAVAAIAQYSDNNRVVSINPLRNGDGTFMQANNPLYYNNSADTIWTKRRAPNTTIGSGDPFAFRVKTLQVMCDLNSTKLNWTTIQQQSDADYFDIQESTDGGATWTSIGTLPASRSTIGEISYSYVYNRTLGNVDLRVAAVNIGGERRYSAVARSACSNTNLLDVDNLVRSTVNIRIGSANNQNVKMLLANQSGFVVLKREIGLTQGINSTSLDVSSLPKGFYMLMIVWQNGRQESVKIIKE